MRHVTQWLRSTHSLVPNKTKRSRSVCEAFGLWGLHIIPTQTWTTVRSVRWTPPRAGQWKLNVDGASQGNPGSSGGGGILRDSTGYIMRCRGRITTITHQFREGNQTADALAAHGVRSRRRTVFSFWQDMPLEARGAHRLERLGIPSLRIHRTPLPASPRQCGNLFPFP
ncbi:unnamed protein product [Spirodela intermedia]|uniref:Uncharacterized protein n=1 Tax=Spirodela intermedia TaxID=51605 RepID=A0A7I8IIH7_SPIIN|nr:unnamed protein product [Spirodela intermedia]CAA6657157.1 unnamed protein product [Spirodela intermedia]